MSLQEVRQRAENDAATHGYRLNPDPQFVETLLQGLRQNDERYGYPSCPCRLSSGKFEFDRDIICPCDYRDPDVEEHGQCYCALYIREDVFKGESPIQPIPERRPHEKQVRVYAVPAVTAPEKPSNRTVAHVAPPSLIKMKMWYCRQCGYVCFREDPPYVCPICKAKSEMFRETRIQADIQG